MTVRTTTVALSQDGIGISGGFDDTTDRLTVFSGAPFPSQTGLVFDYELSFDETGRPLDPPVIVGLELTLTTHSDVIADPGSEVLELWVVPEFDPDDYSGLAIPMNRDEVLVAGAPADWTGAPTTVTFTLGSYPNSDADDAIASENWDTLRMEIMGSSRWQGRLAFSIQATLSAGTWTFASTETADETPPVLTSEQESFHTGVDGWPTDKGRARRCPVTGKPLLADEAVRDEYRKGLWVSAEAADPEDRSQRDFHPSPKEGVVDDELT